MLPECVVRGDPTKYRVGWDANLGKTRLAHRTAYEAAKGPIPDGLTLDHLCRTPGCSNADHLEAVTFAENKRRARKLVCLRGHSLAEAPVYFRNGRPNGQYCRACRELRRAA